MNIGIVSYLPLWPLSGGSSLRVYRYVKELAKEHNISVICPLQCSIEEVKKEVGNIKVYPFRLFEINRFVKFRELKYSLFSLLIIPKLLKIAKKDKLGIIISHNTIGSFSAIFAKKFCKTKYVLDIVDFMTGYMEYTNKFLKIVSRLLNYFEKQLIKKADKIITITDNFKELLEKDYKKEIKVIPDGVDLDFFNKEFKKKKKNIVFYMGMIDPYQGVDLIIKAANLINKKIDAKFWIVGTGSYFDEIKDMIKEMNLNNVKLIGWVDRENILKYLGEADVGLVAHFKSVSNETMFPIKLLEYWAMSKPVVSSDLVQIRKVVRNGVNGYLFEAGNYKDMADKIIKVLKSKDKNKMGKEGRKIVEKNYDWNKLAKEFIKEVSQI